MFPGTAWLNSTPAQAPEQTQGQATPGKWSFPADHLLLQGPQQTNREWRREEALQHWHHTGTARTLDKAYAHCTRDPRPGLPHPEPPAPELEGSRNAPSGRKAPEAPSYWKPPRGRTARAFVRTCRKGTRSVTHGPTGLLWGGGCPPTEEPPQHTPSVETREVTT